MNDQKKQQTIRHLVSDEDKDIPFADFAEAVGESDVGIILSFAQFRPRTGNNHVVGQVMLPMKVAAKTAIMLIEQIVKAEKTTGQKFLPDNANVEIK